MGLLVWCVESQSQGSGKATWPGCGAEQRQEVPCLQSDEHEQHQGSGRVWWDGQSVSEWHGPSRRPLCEDDATTPQCLETYRWQSSQTPGRKRGHRCQVDRVPGEDEGVLCGAAAEILGGRQAHLEGNGRVGKAEAGDHRHDSEPCDQQGGRAQQEKKFQPSADDLAAWNDLMGSERQAMEVEEDVILRQALQAAQDPSAFLNLTLAEIANASGPITENVIPQRGPQLGSGSFNTPSLSGDAVHTPPRRLGAPPGMTPRRPLPPTSTIAGAGDARDRGAPSYTLGEQTLASDPYMTSLQGGNRIMSASPSVEQEASFGPVRVGKQRANATSPIPKRSPKPTLGTDTSRGAKSAEVELGGSGAAARKERPTKFRLIEDDGEKKPQASQELVDLSMME